MTTLRRELSGSHRYRWIAVVLFALTVALLGGSSRPDAVQIVGLRPLAGLFLVAAFYWLGAHGLGPFRRPALLLAALALWMAVQLIPLPPGVWQSLPGRDAVEDIGAALGLADLWRPISLVPSRTLNALASLVVPAAALLLVAASRISRRNLLLVVIALGCLNAVLGILQIIGDPSGPLYFYEISNFGAPVGLFANQNHAAVFSALTLVVIAYAALQRELAFDTELWRAGLASLYLIVLVAGLLGSSRAGLLTTFVALVASGGMLWVKLRADRNRNRGASTTMSSVSPQWIIAGAVLLLAVMIAMFVAADRIPALDRVADGGAFQDLRWEILPTLREMLATYWPLGSGFGSFEEVYHIFEPDSLLFPSYVNMAHNDWAQLIIEGGIPAVLIVAGFLVWFGRSLVIVGRESRSGLFGVIFWGAACTIVLFASLVDYPLRTPLFQAEVIWLLALLAMRRARVETD